ncbi:hypothetical protein F383_34745 [Gossypium arboreum]
MHIVP